MAFISIVLGNLGYMSLAKPLGLYGKNQEGEGGNKREGERSKNEKREKRKKRII